ncbi:hypothetical protein DMB65_11565 [Flavobacterium cheongpyeongense]|uniref:Uncharacterized protein n=1 Tax=Flavobacterium cheongpyeongense TaxID=2212651 RepID=A0A2V4BNG2_9FLAO|nr:hypothetical protein DMB65_11565 [Flavobacterium cheongpyeongense]
MSVSAVSKELICTKAFSLVQNEKNFSLFSLFFILSFFLYVLSSARGMEASYRSSADSPTALGKGANADKVK